MKNQYQQGLSHWLCVTLFAFGLVLSILLTFSGDIFSKGFAQNPADYPRNQALYLNMRDGVKIAIAGHDKGSFVPVPSEATPEITVERNTVYASHIDLPVMKR